MKKLLILLTIATLSFVACKKETAESESKLEPKEIATTVESSVKEEIQSKEAIADNDAPYKVKKGTITYKQTQNGASTTSKHYFDNYGTITATEMKGKVGNQEMNTLMILDHKKNVSHMIHHHLKTIITMSDGDDDDSEDTENEEKGDPTANMKKLPSETICGKTAEGFESEGMKMWMWKGVVLKQEYAGNVISVATDISESVDPSIFTLPKDYKNQGDPMKDLFESMDKIEQENSEE